MLFCRAHLLDHVMYRVGIVATLRSMAKQGGKYNVKLIILNEISKLVNFDLILILI